VLAGGGVLGVFPEGLNGPFRLQRDAHRVGRFLSDDFVGWARRHSAPLVPFVTMGAAEAFPILGRIDSRWWRRKTEWPFLPITPTLLPLPLPVKWRIRFLEPIAPGIDGPAAASSRRLVSDGVRGALQGALAELLAQRRSVLLG
jgi:1-acyl-sn-glycerol-3-phosphate acyltransferase